MTPRILVDTGPLVAMHDRRDALHSWAIAESQRLQGPIFTCEAVITEVCYLLSSMPTCVEGLLDMVSRGQVVIRFSLETEINRVNELMKRYANVPMSFAAACLVRMAEIHDDASVWTVDSDFRIYRKHNRQVIPTVMPRP